MSEERLQVGLTAEEIDSLTALVERELQGAQFLLTLVNKLKAARAGGSSRPSSSRETEQRRA